ncbi:phage major capsid protein [Ruegeria sp. HKCCD7303]|uniref:phage major capsid protein n=1 Tax=Ruegeria sp. HKCCD7303 TaxID=2683013 RepID=UPI001492F4D1|nr:phage major capsid protein [Ruegeria sp. HKCCD7303]NOD67607.1 phage major capsid protein [Ruegeria sp. HKCCD7303]
MTKHFRSIELVVENSTKVDDRRVAMAVSSETPVARGGYQEVLVHSKEAVDLEFITSGRAPVLLDHNSELQIGVVETAWLDGSTLRANIRLGKSGKASDVLADIRDGIRQNVSIGYAIEEVEETGGEIRVTKWRPIEVSIVSIPADMTVGVGRHATETLPILEKRNMGNTTTQEKLSAKDAAQIMQLGMRHDMAQEAESAVEKGTSLTEFRNLVLDKLETAEPVSNSYAPPTYGHESKRDFDLGRFIRGKLSNDWSEAETERRISAELTRETRGSRGTVVPAEALAVRAPMMTTTGASPLVDIEHRPDLFVQSLGAASTAIQAGATVLGGLSRDISIPRETGRPSAAWIAEGGSISEGNPTFDNVTLSATMLAARVSFTRQALMQGLPQLDYLVRQGINRQFAISLDAAVINGSGVVPEPEGILQASAINSFAAASAGAVAWGEVVDAWSRIMTDNVVPDGNMAWLAHPDVAKILRTTLKDAGSGQFVLGDEPSVGDMNTISAGRIMNSAAYETTHMPADKLLLGKFSDVFIGQWGGVDFVIDEVTNASTGVVNIYAYAWFDVAVRHPESFCVITGI